MMGTQVSVVTSHGRQRLASDQDERLIDLLARHGVPWSAVSIYVRSAPEAEPVLTACLDQRLSAFPDGTEVLLYLNRNVNPFLFGLGTFQTVPAEGSETEATEYLYQRLDNSASAADAFLKKLSPTECRSIIAQRVAETVNEHLPRGSHLVVGVSGGGDSNSLLHGLMQMDHGLVVHGVIIKGIPDWDHGVPRAHELCQRYGIELTVMEEHEVKALVGMPEDDVALIDRFEREFRDDDFEFLGTLLIRLALVQRAGEVGASFICTGLNLEDVMCESLFRLASGLTPAGFPVRDIGDMTLVLPLWLCPKRIIDGCFPTYSRENYEARYPCFSLGRNLYYSVVFATQSQFPGYLEQLARGLSQQSLANPVSYVLDSELGLHVERFVPFPLRNRFKRMLGTTAPTS